MEGEGMDPEKEVNMAVFPAEAGIWKKSLVEQERALLNPGRPVETTMRPVKSGKIGAKGNLDLLGDFSEQVGANFG
jgi:hypothetical protein